MAKKLIRVFAQDTYSGGGTFFNDGLYRIEKSQFVKYDFNGSAKGKDGDGLVCLALSLQPVDKDGKDAGEPAVQYWSVGDEFSIEDKGKSIQSTGQYETIWKLCDFAVFVEHLGKAGFDRDAMEDENDISVLAGQIMEFGKVPSPRTQQTPKDDDEGGKKKNFPKQVVVVTDANPLKGKETGKVKGKAAAAAVGGKSKGSDDHEDILQAYLAEKVLVEKNEADGVDKLSARMGIRKYVEGKGGDADTVKAVSALFNDDKVLKAILQSADWTINGNSIVKA